jgi:uncharacterized protein YndB with AHSA1/START domain
MEYASLEREIQIEASPEVVFEVISRPEHLKEWWPDEAEIEPAIGASGHIVFHQTAPEEPKVVPMTILEVQPPRRFSFRWDYEEGTAPSAENSLLVVFELEPSGTGTLVRMTETGFRERGWEGAVLEQNYLDHVDGWNYFIPRLGEYAARVAR